MWKRRKKKKRGKGGKKKGKEKGGKGGKGLLPHKREVSQQLLPYELLS